MRADAAVVVERRNGRSVITTLRSDPPLLLRATPDGLMLVGGAAGPLGGDDLALTVTVAAGARLTVRSVAASTALPGPTPSTLRIDVSVGAGGELQWLPEPLIVTERARHRQRATVRLAEGSALRWRDAVVLGRSGEAPGALDSTLRVECCGRALHHQQLLGATGDPSWGPEWSSPAVVGDSRAVVNDLSVLAGGDEPGPARPAAVVGAADGRAAVFDLGPGAQLVTALGRDLRAAVSAEAATSVGEPRGVAVTGPR